MKKNRDTEYDYLKLLLLKMDLQLGVLSIAQIVFLCFVAIFIQ